MRAGSGSFPARRLLQASKVSWSVSPPGTAAERIEASGAAVVVSSTTGLEACMLGRPLVALTLHGEDTSVDYVGLGAAVGVSAASSLRDALIGCLDRPETRSALALGRQRLLRDALDGGHRRASQKCAQAIIEAIA